MHKHRGLITSVADLWFHFVHSVKAHILWSQNYQRCLLDRQSTLIHDWTKWYKNSSSDYTTNMCDQLKKCADNDAFTNAVESIIAA